MPLSTQYIFELPKDHVLVFQFKDGVYIKDIIEIIVMSSSQAIF